LPAEHVLLNRMQNVNISSDSDAEADFWLIRANGPPTTGPQFMNEAHADTEEELYFKGNTAVWTQGIISNDQVLPQTSLTCETPIKFGLFCSDAFIRSAEEYDADKTDRKAVFLIDETCLKVYCSNGETFVTSVEGQISKVWTTRDVILLEKEPSVSLFDSHTINMPRLFSLGNPLDEMCPVLLKTPTGINYVTEGEQKIVFADCETNLVLMFDTRIGRHLVFMLRKANNEEMAACAAFNETNMNSMNCTSQVYSTGNASRGNLTKQSCESFESKWNDPDTKTTLNS
jgi:anaphase-promoting complex subunit 1